MTFPRDPNAPRPRDHEPESTHPTRFTVAYEEREVTFPEDRAANRVATAVATVAVAIVLVAFLLAVVAAL